uniref:Uncharacterized protein n=1 Tax=Arundo donax TaxID=35708 RepID=A0A0A8Y237_ARUDO
MILFIFELDYVEVLHGSFTREIIAMGIF